MSTTPLRKTRYKIRSRRRKYVLTGGCARCGKCLEPLSAQPIRTGRSYQCKHPGCGGVRIMAEALETYVAAEVLAKLASPAGRKELRAAFMQFSETETVTERLATLRARLQELGGDYARDGMSLAAFKAADREINDEIDDLVDYLDRIDKLAPLSTAKTAKQLALWWEFESTIDQRHALIVTVVDVVVVHPAPRSVNVVDTDRVQIKFR